MELQLELRAISPDNERDLRSICSLYSLAYAEEFPVKSVYQLEFWKSHIGRRFISVAAFAGDEMVAHVALSPDPHDSRHVQICYPVCAGDEHFSLFASSLGTLLTSLSFSRGWSLASLSIFVPVPGMQRFLEALPGSCQCAILPCYPASDDYPNFSDLLFPTDSNSADFPARHVVVAVCPLGSNASRPGSIFLPSEHSRMATLTLNQFALAVASLQEPPAEDTLVKEVYGTPAVREFYPFSGVCHQFVKPSQIPSVQALVTELSASPVRVPYIYVDARDAHCPAFCEALVEEGFAFCGMIPELRGTDHIVFCRLPDLLSLESRLFEAAPAKLMCEYLTSSCSVFAQPEEQSRLSA